MDGGRDEPSCAELPPRLVGSCEECGDSGGVLLRRGGSVYDAVANLALRGRGRIKSEAGPLHIGCQLHQNCYRSHAWLTSVDTVTGDSLARFAN